MFHYSGLSIRRKARRNSTIKKHANEATALYCHRGRCGWSGLSLWVIPSHSPLLEDMPYQRSTTGHRRTDVAHPFRR